MASDPLTDMLDPLHFWRKALTELESRGNTLSTQYMRTAEGAAAVNQFAQLHVSLQSAVEKALGAYLNKLNLPSRAELLELGEQLQRIEDKLDTLNAGSSARDQVSRPARTRQPPASVAADVAPPVVAAAPKKAAARQATGKRPAARRAANARKD